MLLHLTENIAFLQFVIVTASDFCHTDFAPAGFDAARHMLEVIVIEKDTLQVVDDHIDCPVGGVPDFAVIGAPGCGDPDVNMAFSKRGMPIFACLAMASWIIRTQCSSRVPVSSFSPGSGSGITKQTI